MAAFKKGALRKGQMPVFIDESGFYLLPATVRTYAPCGVRPQLRVYQTHAHLGVMCGLTPAGDLFSYIESRSLTEDDSVRFLQHLRRQLGCRLLIIWDRINIHRSKVVKAFLAQVPAGSIQVEELPNCAPELNPQEGVWHLLKDVELKNVCCRDLQHLALELRLAIRRVRSYPSLALSCFQGAGLDL
jgi:transposase